MTLTPGTALGPYEIVAAVGAGRFLVPAANQADTNPDHVNVLIGWRSKID
jgi:hypothetical protein